MPKNHPKIQLHKTAKQWLMKWAERLSVAWNVTEIGRKTVLSDLKTTFTCTPALTKILATFCQVYLNYLLGLQRYITCDMNCN